MAKINPEEVIGKPVATERLAPNDAEGRARFIRTNTVVGHAPLVPEIALHLSSAVTLLWQATEDYLDEVGVDPPYWAFAWPGGQALARYVLDHPDLVAGKRVLDFAAGCAIAGLTAAKVGAEVTVNDIDAMATTAAGLNAALNGLVVTNSTEDLSQQPAGGYDVILAGDVCYERPMTDRVLPWLRANAEAGALVLLADPGRAYLPSSGLVALATYVVPTTLDLEDRTQRETTLWRLVVESDVQR